MPKRQNIIEEENKQEWLTHHIDQPGVVTRVGTRYFTELHGMRIGKGGRDCKILFYDGEPSKNGKLIIGLTITENYMFKRLDCTAYNGLYCLVLVDKDGIMGDFTLYYA